MIKRAAVAIDNFSYRIIDSTLYKMVPSSQQMIVYQEVQVEDTGELDIEGEVVIITWVW